MDMKMLIGGSLVDAAGGAVINNVDPYDGSLIGTVPSAARADVERAVACAVRGQREWAALRHDQREALIERFLSLLTEHEEELAQLLCRESGKTISICRAEIRQIPLIYRAYLHAAATLFGKSLPCGIEPRNLNDAAFTRYEPLGVCVCIAPFNYPLSLLTNKLAPALLAGNSVIAKPASDTPMSTLRYVELMWEAGFSGNVVQAITGSGSQVGQWITDDPGVAAVSLTGSVSAGVSLYQGAGKHLQRIHLELGGNDPLIVFPDCDLDKAAAEAVAGRLPNAGQTCSGSKRFLVHNSIREAFTEKLIAAVSACRAGAPTDEEADYSCLINLREACTVEEQIRHTVEQGARCVLGGRRNGSFVEPTVLTGVTPDMDVARDLEIFGPVFPIIGFDTFEEAIAIANQTSYGLSSGVMTENIHTGMKAAGLLKAGTCVINGNGDYRNSYHPFGGCKMSGLGREGALLTLAEFCEVKTIVLREAFS